jgi:hypothetical protein
VSLSYLCGAGVMFWRLPSYGFLESGFTGAEIWYERSRGKPSADEGAGPSLEARQIAIDRPGETFDGFTLYACTQGSWAALLDMRGGVVHRWEKPFRLSYPGVPSPRNRSIVPDPRIHWFALHLYTNGDLLALYHTDGDAHYGYGLVKLDKDSNLLWAYPPDLREEAGNVHHAVDVGEDGTIYTLVQRFAHQRPAGLEFLPSPYLTDELVLLSPDGKERKRVPLLEPLCASGLDLESVLRVKGLPPGRGGRRIPHHAAPGDVLHANSVRVLTRALAPKFPQWKPGQVLISFRSLDALAVIDPGTGAAAWAARGMWRGQHDAQFLDNGHLLLFDNLGHAAGACVLEIDPRGESVPWWYAEGADGALMALSRGSCQRLPNGNTLIVDPDRARIFEVSPARRTVWECYCPHPSVTSARRYSAAQLPFLKAGTRARP